MSTLAMVSQRRVENNRIKIAGGCPNKIYSISMWGTVFIDKSEVLILQGSTVGLNP